MTADTDTRALAGQNDPEYLKTDTLEGLAALVAHLDPEALAKATNAAGLDFLTANELRYRAQAIAKGPDYPSERGSLERDLQHPESYVLTGSRIAQVHVNDPNDPTRGMVISINDEGREGPWVQVFPKVITPEGEDLVGDDDVRLDGSDWSYDDELTPEVLDEIRASHSQ